MLQIRKFKIIVASLTDQRVHYAVAIISTFFVMKITMHPWIPKLGVSHSHILIKKKNPDIFQYAHISIYEYMIFQHTDKPRVLFSLRRY